ncbi:hypothetical protein ACFO0S_04460 [Chryseomicrobium palamuruense]|uniref:Addiction module toxin RelE n=1 Tax=Chryseomicrobium palamuruense TaxID=682973 RepID=A0ABV8UUB3_9BACL
MEKEPKFDLRFDPDAAKEYAKLKNPVLTIVNKSLDELEYRADEVGKSLGNKRDLKLAGCKEIKLRDAGIRIIFRITETRIEVLKVVQLLAIEKRSRDMVFKLASKRLSAIKKVEKSGKIFQSTRRWKKFSLQDKSPLPPKE